MPLLLALSYCYKRVSSSVGWLFITQHNNSRAPVYTGLKIYHFETPNNIVGYQLTV